MTTPDTGFFCLWQQPPICSRQHAIPVEAGTKAGRMGAKKKSASNRLAHAASAFCAHHGFFALNTICASAYHVE